MTVRWLLTVVLVINVLVLVICTESSTKSVKPPRCRKVKKCPRNEEFSYCPQSIRRAQYCSEKAEPSTCRTKSNKPGCVCKENYLRAENGTCIPAEQCPLTCDDNEVLDNCPSYCESDSCAATEADTFAKPCVPQEECPPPACKCGFNRRRADNGSCILTRDCPPFDCTRRPNEEYNPCPPLCPTDDCSQASPTGECPPQFGRIGIILPCNPKCRCIEGYWRLNGTCVPYGECPGVCPDNERYSTCIQAECRALNCTQKDQSVPCIRMDPLYCQKGCVCQEGYLRNQDGLCVLEEKCEPPLTCDDNEVLDNCPSYCESDSCAATEADTFAKPCVPQEECPPPACKCGFNRRRADNGSCILTKDCPPFDCTRRPNEEYNPCPPLCPTDDCSQASPTGECPPQFGRIGIILPCNPKCKCIEGYWRLNGTCVPYGECPGVCPDNERYSTCIQAECRALNCTQKDQSVPCIRMDPLYCQKGCVCQEGYLRNQDGVCVLEEKCEPPLTCDDNEVLDNCPSNCESDSCAATEADTFAKPCVAQEGCPPPACKCGFNRRRADNGSCIPTRDCPAFDCTRRPNEEYNPCPPLCPTDDCSQASPTGECPPHFGRIGIILPCNPKCRCIEGYWRLNGTCVPYGECPGVCPDNERYSTCIQAECRALNCTQKDQSVPCKRIDPMYCQKGCVCQEGYLRNQDGVCVLEEKCEPGVCPDNERYSTCIQAECLALNCTQKDQSVPCVRMNPLYCQKGCVCQEGYLRNQDGVCVLEEKCEPTCPANEEFVPCMQGVCRAKDCSEKGQDVPCPDIPREQCDSGCICKEGFLRTENGNCVLEDECLTCGENEVLDECPNICNTDNCPLSANETQVCTKADPCIPACKCRFNYKRAENKTCIPTRDCPPFDCSSKPNEEFVACPPYCPTDSCYKPRLDGRCQFRIGIVLECQPKCQCKDGYGKVNGTCVPFEECPNLCPANEEYSPCVQRLCRRQSCSDRDLVMETCPTCDAAECQRGCVCQKNYYRNDKGNCVSYKECKGLKCPNAHEVYEPNFKECPPNTCGALVARYKCDKNQKERPGCRCQDGYLRLNETDRCVPICECPEMKYSADCSK